MNFNQMVQAIEDAELTMKKADMQSEKLANLLVGRLRKVTKDNLYRQHSILRKLKKELSQYNASTRTWKN